MTRALVTLAPEELELLNELLEERIGAHFPASRSFVLEGRLRPRLAALGLTSFMDYYLHLRLAGDGEIEKLGALVTNHESYFFREPGPFRDLLESDVLKSLAGGEACRALCVGCASGEEAYSLAILAQEARQRLERQLRIDAFDIDPRCIQIAESAEYGDPSLREIEPAKIQRYFEMGSRRTWVLKPIYRQGLRFWCADLLDPLACGADGRYELIACRHVIGSFSESAKLRALENLARVLRPGGLLCLGHDESLLGRSPHFEMTRIGRSILYRRT